MRTTRHTTIPALVLLGVAVTGHAGALAAAIQAQDYEPPRRTRARPSKDETAETKRPRALDARLVQAARTGDLEALRAAAGEEGALHRTDSQEHTLLHVAAGAGQAESVAFLLREGVDASRIDLSGYTAAHTAARVGRLAVVEVLVDLESGVDVRDGKGRTLLLAAAEGSQLELIDELLRRGADLRAVDADGLGVLHHAAFTGKSEVVEHLLELGASLENRSARGETALHRAALGGPTSVVQILLERGLDPNAKDATGRTPLTYTFGPRNLPTARALLEAGADPNVPDDDGKTPFYHAFYSDNPLMVKALIPDVTLGSVDPDGNTALHYVARGMEQPELVQALIARGAKVNARNRAGRTPLHVAHQRQSAQVARNLIRAGADPDLRDLQGLRAVPTHRYALLRKPTRFKLSRRNDAETREIASGSLVRLRENRGRDSRPNRSLSLISSDWCGARNVDEISLEDLEILSSEKLAVEARKERGDRTFLGTTHGGRVALFATLDPEGSFDWCNARGQLFVDIGCGVERQATVYGADGSVSDGRLTDIFGDACAMLGAGGLLVEEMEAPEPAIISTRPLPAGTEAKTPDYSELGNEAVSVNVLREMDLDGDGVNELIVRYLVDEEGYRRAIYQHDGERWVRRIPRFGF